MVSLNSAGCVTLGGFALGKGQGSRWDLEWRRPPQEDEAGMGGRWRLGPEPGSSQKSMQT